jgi:hypothetical protein
MALGCLFVSFAYVVFTGDFSLALGWYLVISAFGSFMLAFIDAAGEKMGQRCAA